MRRILGAGAFWGLVLGALLAWSPASRAEWSPESAAPNGGPRTSGAPQQTPVFRGGTTVVPLTVTVLDRDGKPVTDLKQTDFTVLENGKPREIVNFFPQPFEGGAAAPPAVAPTLASGIAPQTRRTFLIVLGYGRIQYPTKAVDGAIDFVRRGLLPQDAVAVMAFHRTTDLTTDHEQVAQLLERYKRDHEKLVLEINEYRVMSRSPYPLGGSGGPPIPAKFLNRIDAIFSGAARPGGRPAEGSIPFRSTTGLLFGMDRPVPVVSKPGQYQQTFQDLQQEFRDSGDELTDAVLIGTREKFFAGVEYLRYLNGEKHMLMLANGIVRNVDDARVLAQRAADARVVVDFIAANGTNRFGGGGGSPAGRELADLTGGYYTSVEMASKAVAKVDQGTRFSYLLGYAPSNPTLDGRYRDVEVKVNRPGVTVRYGHGYFAAAQPEPLALKEMIVKSRVDAALSYFSEANDITLAVTVTTLPRMGVQAQARVEVIIDASPLGFEAKDGLRTASLEVQAYVGDARENVIGEFGERLDLEGDEATYGRWMQGGIRRVLRVPFMDEARFVKVVVYDYGSDRSGSAMITIK